MAVSALWTPVDLGGGRISVHTRADRDAPHRFKAAESHGIDAVGRPLVVYLDQAPLVGAAIASGADAFHARRRFPCRGRDLAFRIRLVDLRQRDRLGVSGGHIDQQGKVHQPGGPSRGHLRHIVGSEAQLKYVTSRLA